MKTRLPALGAEGWFADGDEPRLLGSQCGVCGNVAFPPETYLCGNPTCAGTGFTTARLGPTGTVWSYTDLRYQPPAPFVAPRTPYEPAVLLAVEVDRTGLVVLGQAVAGIGVEQIRVGTRVTLVVDVLFSDDEHDYTMWKWQLTGEHE